MSPLQQLAMLCSDPSSLQVLTVGVGRDAHPLLLWPSNEATGWTGESASELQLTSRIASNELWLGETHDGLYVLSDSSDDSAFDNPAYDVNAVVRGGLPLLPGEGARVNWSTSMADQTAVTIPNLLSALTWHQAFSYFWPFEPVTACLADYLHSIYTSLLKYHMPSRGVLEITVSPSVAYLNKVGPVFQNVAHLIPRSIGTLNNGQQWNVVLDSVSFQPMTSMRHAEHRVEHVVRLRSSDGRGLIECYIVKGAVSGVNPVTEALWHSSMFGDATTTLSVIPQDAPLFCGRRLDTPRPLGMAAQSVARSTLKWAAMTGYSLVASAVTVTNVCYVLRSVPAAVGRRPNYPSEATFFECDAWSFVFRDAGLRVKERLKAAVHGTANEATRLSAIESIDYDNMALTMVGFAGGVPIYRDCVQRSGIYRLAREGEFKVDLLSQTFDDDTTWRQLRNRAGKAVDSLGLAYLTSADGDDFADDSDPGSGLPAELRALVLDSPQRVLIQLFANEVVISDRRFDLVHGRVNFLAMSSNDRRAVWQDVTDLVHRGAPIEVREWDLLVDGILGGVLSTEEERGQFLAQAEKLGETTLIGTVGHPLYITQWLWDLRQAHITSDVFLGAVAERSCESFSTFYLQHGASIEGPAISGGLRNPNHPEDDTIAPEGVTD